MPLPIAGHRQRVDRIYIGAAVQRRPRGRGVLAFEIDCWNRASRSGRQDEMRVAGVESVGDAPADPVQHDILTPDRPLAGEGPVVDAQTPGELVGAAYVDRDTLCDAKCSLRPYPRYVSGVRR